jgi:hypothetical protein
MSWLRNMAGGLGSLFRKERVERELDEELRTYLAMAVEEKMKQGMSREDALRAVRLEEGNLETTKEIVHAAGWESLLETTWQDLRPNTPRSGRDAAIVKPPNPCLSLVVWG